MIATDKLSMGVLFPIEAFEGLCHEWIKKNR